jgi:hypothetical protein
MCLITIVLTSRTILLRDLSMAVGVPLEKAGAFKR